METIFISHKVEHPMTVMFSPSPFASGRTYHDCLVYNSWTYRTLNGKKINSHSPLN